MLRRYRKSCLGAYVQRVALCLTSSIASCPGPQHELALQIHFDAALVTLKEVARLNDGMIRTPVPVNSNA